MPRLWSINVMSGGGIVPMMSSLARSSLYLSERFLCGLVNLLGVELAGVAGLDDCGCILKH